MLFARGLNLNSACSKRIEPTQNDSKPSQPKFPPRRNWGPFPVTHRHNLPWNLRHDLPRHRPLKEREKEKTQETSLCWRTRSWFPRPCLWIARSSKPLRKIWTLISCKMWNPCMPSNIVNGGVTVNGISNSSGFTPCWRLGLYRLWVWSSKVGTILKSLPSKWTCVILLLPRTPRHWPNWEITCEGFLLTRMPFSSRCRRWKIPSQTLHHRYRMGVFARIMRVSTTSPPKIAVLPTANLVPLLWMWRVYFC